MREVPEGFGCAFWAVVMLALYAVVAIAIVALVKWA